MNIRPGQSVDRRGLRKILDALAPEPGQAASSLYLAPGSGLESLGKMGTAAQGWRDALNGLGRSVLASDTGLAGLRPGPGGYDRGLVVAPPFPLSESRAVDGWDVGPLLDNVDAGRMVGVALLRLGRSTVAVFRLEGKDGEGRKGRRQEIPLEAKTDSRYVKGKHHAGGTSQRRFQRIREGQARKMYDKTCETVRARFGPYEDELEYVFLGGDRITLVEFLKVCPWLERFRSRTLSRRLNIRDPKRDTLEQVPEMLRECKLYPVEFPGAPGVAPT